MKLQLIQTIALFGSLATAMPLMSISITITEEGSADVSSPHVHNKVSKAREPVLMPNHAGGTHCYLLCAPSPEKAGCPSDMVRESHMSFLSVADG